MSANEPVDLRKLNAFLRRYKNTDFRTVDLLSQTSLDNFNWPDEDEEKASLLGHLKAYQRLLRVLPSDNGERPVADIAKALLKINITSALQIASMGKKSFARETLKIFSSDQALTEQVYKRALAARKVLALRYIGQQQSLEPHVRAAGLNR